MLKVAGSDSTVVTFKIDSAIYMNKVGRNKTHLYIFHVFKNENI